MTRALLAVQRSRTRVQIDNANLNLESPGASTSEVPQHEPTEALGSLFERHVMKPTRIRHELSVVVSQGV
jgi:hypothetical protein